MFDCEFAKFDDADSLKRQSIDVIAKSVVLQRANIREVTSKDEGVKRSEIIGLEKYR